LLQLLGLSEGRSIASARLQVLSPVTSAPTSEWAFGSVRLTVMDIADTPNPMATARIATFSLGYDDVTYRVFGADGTVQTCFDLIHNRPC